MLIRLGVNSFDSDAAAIEAAVAHLRAGRIVAFPTQTLYGLAGDPRNAEAVGALFERKGRAADAAIPLIASDIEQVARDAGEMTPLARSLAAGFWPGPLTLVLDARRAIVPAVQAGTGTVAVRVSAHT